MITIDRSTVLSPCWGSPSKPGIRVQSPAQAPQLLVHALFPSFYLVSTPVNNLHMGRYTVVETHSTHVPLELPFSLGWCKRCIEQRKIQCLSMSSWHTISCCVVPVLTAQQRWAPFYPFLKPHTKTWACH